MDGRGELDDDDDDDSSDIEEEEDDDKEPGESDMRLVVNDTVDLDVVGEVVREKLLVRIVDQSTRAEQHLLLLLLLLLMITFDLRNSSR